MAKKLDPTLLQEELKKFKVLSEYTFYTEKDEKNNDLILGSGVDEADENPESEPAPDADVPAPDADPAADPAAAAAPAGDDNLFDTGDQTADPAAAAPPPVELAPPVAPPTDEVEVDVTQLVDKSDEAARASMEAGQKTDQLMTKFDELEQRISGMDALSHKIETLEKEIIKRNPTPVEKLEMRSLDSFPFNIKISDYWKDEIPGYEARGESEPKDYILTKDDVDSTFTDISVKKSLDNPEEYDEEEVY